MGRLSKNSEVTVNNSSIGFVGVLAILFIALKLTGVITWPWLWVLAPIWISWLIIAVLVIGISCAILYGNRSRNKERRLRKIEIQNLRDKYNRA